jgi:hypothetical protein
MRADVEAIPCGGGHFYSRWQCGKTKGEGAGSDWKIRGKAISSDAWRRCNGRQDVSHALTLGTLVTIKAKLRRFRFCGYKAGPRRAKRIRSASGAMQRLSVAGMGLRHRTATLCP